MKKSLLKKILVSATLASLTLTSVVPATSSFAEEPTNAELQGIIPNNLAPDMPSPLEAPEVNSPGTAEAPASIMPTWLVATFFAVPLACGGIWGLGRFMSSQRRRRQVVLKAGGGGMAAGVAGRFSTSTSSTPPAPGSTGAGSSAPAPPTPLPPATGPTGAAATRGLVNLGKKGAGGLLSLGFVYKVGSKAYDLIKQAREWVNTKDDGFHTKEDIIKNFSALQVEDGEKALMGQMLPKAISIADGNEKPGGNVIFVAGGKKAQKRRVAKAVANAALKNPDQAVLHINLKELPKNLQTPESLFGLIETVNINGSPILGDQRFAKQLEQAPALKHLVTYEKGCVIIFDGFEIPKQNNNQISLQNQPNQPLADDNSLIPFFSSISTNGEYSVLGKNVAAPNALFIVLTDESPRNISKIFGYNNVIESKSISKKDLEQLAKEFIIEINNEINKRYGCNITFSRDAVTHIKNNISDKDDIEQSFKTLSNRILAPFVTRLHNSGDQNTCKIDYRPFNKDFALIEC